MVNLEGIASFPENLFLSAFICAVLGERDAASLIIWVIFRICTYLICARFLQSTGLVMKVGHSPFFVYQPWVAT